MAEELEALVCAADHIISRASPATSRASPEGAEGAEEAAAGMAMWQQVWCEQQAVGAHEVYATCEPETGGSGGDGGNASDASDASNGGSSDGRSASDGSSASGGGGGGGGGGGAASDAAAEVLARGLRRGFAASAEWREGARERRDAYLTESTRAALAAL